jgi:replication-associated recombination protein RarA
MAVPDHRDDPWTRVTAASGLAADELISTLQKSIRRGDEYNAALCAHDMTATSTELEEVLWDRLHVIAIEDIGLARPYVIVVVSALAAARQRFPAGSHDRLLLAIHAVRLLASSPKDRANDELASVMLAEVAEGERPAIPDHALDMHTRRGQEMGRGVEHFLTEGARVAPEDEGRDRQWRQRLLERLALPPDPP